MESQLIQYHIYKRKWMSVKSKLFEEYFENNELNIEKLVNDYYRYINRIISNKAKNYLSIEDKEEIISDVFLVIWNNKERIDKEKYIEPYISSVIRNLISVKFRKIDSTINIDEVDIPEENSIDIIVESKEKDFKIEKALSGLSSDARQVFILFYYKNMKVKDIANKLNISVNNVKVMLSRTRKKLKKILKDKE